MSYLLSEPEFCVVVEMDQMVEMRDGVLLATDAGLFGGLAVLSEESTQVGFYVHRRSLPLFVSLFDLWLPVLL